MSASLDSSGRKRPRPDHADAAGKASKKPRKSPEPTTARKSNGVGEKETPVHGTDKKSKKSKASESSRDRTLKPAVNGPDEEVAPSRVQKHDVNLDIKTPGEVNGVEVAKKKRKKPKKAHSGQVTERALPEPTVETEKVVAKRKEPTWSWTASEPLCGQFLEQDPIFSHNEKCVARPSYSTSLTMVDTCCFRPVGP
jgi:hypothetical protein